MGKIELMLLNSIDGTSNFTTRSSSVGSFLLIRKINKLSSSKHDVAITPVHLKDKFIVPDICNDKEFCFQYFSPLSL